MDRKKAQSRWNLAWIQITGIELNTYQSSSKSVDYKSSYDQLYPEYIFSLDTEKINVSKDKREKKTIRKSK